jgi:ABC-type branched-subunit amino acid transport system substrate-binding protein
MGIMSAFGARRSIGGRVIAGMALLAAAGCTTTGGTRRGATAAAAPEDAAPVAAPVVTAAPAPTIDPGPPQNRVALLVPTTGGNAAVGQSIANAANMALLDSNQQRIKLTVYNTATGAAAAASRAVADGNKLFLGPLLAPDVRAVSGIASGAGIPILSFSNDVTLAGGNTYVLGFQPGQSISRVVAFARSRGVERFAALVPSGTYGQRASSAFMRAVQSSGGKVTGVEIFPRDRAKLGAAARRITNYEARVARAAQAGIVRPDGTVAPVQQRLGAVPFQALLIADSGNVTSAFLPLLQQFGAGPSQARLLGPELWNAEPGLATRPGMHGAWFAAVPDNRFQQLASRYRAKFGGTPSRLASLGYDSVLLVNSIANRWQIGSPFPRGALSDPDGFAGIDGIFRFTGNVADRGLEVQQINPGGFATVSAAPRAFRNTQVSAIN